MPSTPSPITGIDHVALLVRDIDASLPYFTDRLGFTLVGDERTAAAGGARLAYLDAGAIRLQLVSPTGTSGPLVEHLATRGEGLHHICLTVDHIERALRELAPEDAVQPVVGGRARRTAFLPGRPSGLVIELVESEPYRPDGG